MDFNAAAYELCFSVDLVFIMPCNSRDLAACVFKDNSNLSILLFATVVTSVKVFIRASMLCARFGSEELDFTGVTGLATGMAGCRDLASSRSRTLTDNCSS